MMSNRRAYIILSLVAVILSLSGFSHGRDHASLTKNKSIIAAIAKGDHEDVAVWIANGEDINAQNSAGWTPLHYAAIRNKIKCAQLLLENGSKLSVATKTGKTPLHFSAKRNYIEMARMLVKKGSDLAAKEQDGWTPLHYAAAHDHIDMAKFLIKSGSDVNAVSTGGGTPLIEAAAGSSWQMIDMLLQKGADKSIKAKNGKTALDYAVELKNDEARDLLEADLWFHVGEQLVHKIYWGFIPVGKSVTSSRWIEEDEKRLIAVRIRTRTNKIFDKIRPVNDVVESIIDPKTFLPVRFQRKMTRRKKRCDELTKFNYKDLSATWAGKCAHKTNSFDIAKDTRDILTFTYVMRKDGFSKNSDTSYTVMADEGLFSLGIKAGKTEKITLPVFGKVESLCIDPTFDFDGLLVDKGKFRLWLSQDQRRLMGKTVIDGKLADIKVVLCKVLGPGDDFWIRKMKEANESLETIEPKEIENILLK